jgi:hypothetical protein
MEYLFERKVKINREPKYKNLYSWCLNEFDDNGNLIGQDLVPFSWGFWFTGTSLQVTTKLDVERDYESDKSKAITSKSIIGKFYSGICFDGKKLSDEVVFSMFGTARTINEFYVSISEAKSDNEEACLFTAIPSYKSEGAEFQKVIEKDYVGFDIYIHSEKFNELVKLVESHSLSSVSFSVKGVDGIYAEWTPTIKTYAAKILTSDNVIEGVGETKFKCPTVSVVKEFSINFISQTSLSLKQNLPLIDFPKSFDSDLIDKFEEEKLNISQVGNPQSSINLLPLIQVVKSLKVALWFIFAVLLFLLLKS